MKIKQKNQKKTFLMVLFAAFIATSISLFIPKEEPAKAQNIVEQKLKQAASMELPTVAFKAEPSYMVKKGGEVSLFTTFQNYAGEGNQAENILYNWCIDNIPINSIMAGSTDTVTEENGKVIVQNQYGVLEGGKGSCNISTLYDPYDFVRVIDNLDGKAEAEKRLRETFDGNDRLALQRYTTNDFINRLKRIGVPSIGIDLFKAEINTINNDASLKDAEKVAKLKDLQNKFLADAKLTEGSNIKIPSFFASKASVSYAALKADAKDVTKSESVFITRKPASDDDIDGDGMSDAWELQNFGKFAGKNGVELKTPDAPDKGYTAIDFLPKFIQEITGLTNPNKVDIRPIHFGGGSPKEIYGDFLEDIKPEDDYDADGFLWGENYGRCVEEFFGNAPKESQVKKIFDGETCWWKRNEGLSDGWAIFFSVLVGFPIQAGKGSLIPGPIFEAWQAGVPYAKLSGKNQYDNYEIKIDTGYFPNGAEYVFGTNPLEADTDGDGVPDAYDVAGLKQNSVPLKIQKDDDYEIDVHVYGMSQKGSLSRGEEGSKGDNGYNNTPYLFWRTDLENQKLKVGGGLPLPTQLTYSPYPATIKNVGCSGNSCAEALRVEAATVSGEVGSGALFYTWYLDGILLPASDAELTNKKGEVSEEIGYIKALGDKSEFSKESNRKTDASATASPLLTPSGYGKNSFEFSVNYGKTLWEKLNTRKKWSAIGPCTERKVGVDVIDEETGKTTHAEIPIPIGDTVNLSEKLISNIDPSNNDLLVGFNLNDHTLKKELIREVVVPHLDSSVDKKDEKAVSRAISDQKFNKNAASLLQVDPKKGYRRGDMVSVKAELSQEDSQCPAGYYDGLVYKWYFDDLFLEDESGRGKNTIVVVMSNLGSDLREQEDAGSHYLRFEAVDPKTNLLFARTLKELRVIAPYVDFGKPTGTEGVANVSSEGVGTAATTYKVQPGATVKIIAKPQYFRPLPDGSGGLGFEYTWRRNGDIIEGASRTVPGTIPSEAELEFTVGNEPNALDEISLEVKTSGDASLATEAESKQLGISTVIFDTNPPEGGNPGDVSFGAASAALSKFIPEQYRQAFNGAFVLGGFALLGFIALALYRGKQQEAK